MHIARLVTAACLAIYTSGAVVSRYTTAPSRKRQGDFLDGFGFIDGGVTRTSGILPTTTSSATSIPSISRVAVTITKGLLPNLEGVLLPPDGPTTTDSSVLSTVSSSTNTRTPTSSKSAVVLTTPPGTLTISSSMGPAAPGMTSWRSTASPSSTSSAAPSSATSANSTWKTVGIAVSVVTLIGLTILLVVFYEQWTAFLRDVFLCRRSARGQDPLGDEEFLPDKHRENYRAPTGSFNGKWAREIRESARLSNIRYPTDVFFGRGSALAPGKAGIGAGGGVGKGGVGAGEFGQLDRPS